MKLAFTLIPFLVVATSLSAQDQFGSDVAVSNDQVLVLKPFVGRGPAAVFVYGRDGSGWSLAERLNAASVDGSGVSPSMAASGNRVLVAGRDADVARGAWVFSKSGSMWAESSHLQLKEATEAAADQSLDLPTLFAILQPAQRTVAANGTRAVIAVLGSQGGEGTLKLFELRNGRWTEQADLVPTEGTRAGGFGAAIAMDDHHIVVGAPMSGRSGAVYVFGGSGSDWHSHRIEADSIANGARFGSSVQIDGSNIVVGAPRDSNGTVLVFRESNGAWMETVRIGVANAEGARFGSSLAVAGDELWVGAPGTNQGVGAVHRYARARSRWNHSETIAPLDAEENGAFGSSVALGRNLAAVGAPNPGGVASRVAIFTRSGNTWSEPSWVALENPMAMHTGEEVRCTDGVADGFRCQSVDLLAYLPTSAFGGAANEGVSDIWGWTDPDTRREYALVGRRANVAFLDITDPINPRYLGYLVSPPSGARDIKVYKDHMFATGDGSPTHGLRVFDLARLRNVVNPPEAFEPDAVYDNIASAHNLVVDTYSGFAYPVGASAGGNTCGGGLHMVDIRDPKHPTFAGCYTDTEGLIWAGRTHDAQCVEYSGPDTDHTGRQICFASNETALRIVDVTDKENPEPLSAATYPGLAYVHQGWLTDDMRYFYLDDELDELIGTAEHTRTLIWDVTDLDEPVLLNQYFGPEPATDHNLYIKGDRMYQANYQAGFRVVDISDRANPREIGYFDTTPYEGNPAGFNGAWTAYPFFESGTVIVSSMAEGLFILRPRQELTP